MRHLATLLAGILFGSMAGAGDVYVTTDAKGQRIYTDIPQTVSAQKVEIHSQSMDPAAAEQDHSPDSTRYAQKGNATPSAAAQQAAPAMAEDRAARCAEVRLRYEMLMSSLRVYTLGPNGEQNFLTVEQISEERSNAKQFLDKFCTDQ